MKPIRILAVALIVAAIALGQISVDPGIWDEIEFQKYRSFVMKLDQFNRKLGGCPANGLDVADCKSGFGTFDAALWNRMRKDAQEVFNLADK